MKTSQHLSRNMRAILRQTSIHAPSRSGIHTGRLQSQIQPQLQARQRSIATSLSASQRSSFSSTAYTHKGLQPDTSDPTPPNTSQTGPPLSSLKAATLSDSEYHEIADQYLEDLQKALEEKAEDVTAGIEMEYSQGVLNITTPQGIYVLNKQPPNKQIWISSPVSGPKRFDWVVSGEGQNTKEGTETIVGDDGSFGGGRWIYLRDGTVLSDLVRDEIKVDVDVGAASGEDVSEGK